ncbi:MAG TPA: substrate-binding domain-containing protein [Candidatus Atribacteria bacterium]|jgi:simple sugar transport system substrate-binding protein|uniref:sugar ABC transporter substrate-binding protein n=1 Tax=Candidatus Sordicultor fermentans TaxID=1953203 RepID=UPI0016AA9EB0|nr:substrate-binding domain-containing protein [Atribacterota bacterium]MDI9608556.1 substrate-binding domain-containing protein [Atribacterota bacterium]NLY05287.1 substrate-binding domain-containing protein [Candidatus Atribacteria bacterium]HOQ50625.1 substrate-binding domain-containing protein [Candidatus Atribacteria bacterium]HPT63406.1 substrate-binding domain-containing protein [Candidatus Atribacteria bacterium]
MKRTRWLVVFLVIGLLVLGSSFAFAEGKRFEGIKVRFFCGGAPGDPFASVVYKGAQFAEEDLGCTVEYVFSGWDPERMVVQFKEAVASDVDGIAIMGHPGDDALETHIDEAFSKGIIVTSQNTTLPRAEEKYKARGFGYVGQELYESGVTLGKGCVEMFDLKSGDRAMVWGLLSQPTRGLRTKGVIDALEEAGLTVDYIEISPEVNADAPLGVPIFTGYVSSHPDVKLVVTDHGSLTATLQTFCQAAGLGPDDVVGAGFDLSSATLEAIRSGYTDLVLDQQQFLQGYLPVLQLCMTIKYKFSGLHIDTGSGLVHAGNVEEIAPLVEEGIR